jgi:hypothetical protein
MSKMILKITGEAARKAICRYVLAAPEGHMVRIGEPTRSLDANAAQWPWLEGFAQQVSIPINGEKMKVDNETWKEILTACYRGEDMRFAAWQGKTILLPQHTSTMGKRIFSDWLAWLIAEAVTNNVTPVFKTNAEIRGGEAVPLD